MGQRTISLVTLVVPDYDLAIAYFTTKLGFVVVSDKVVSDSKRWVVVRPGSSMEGCGLLLAKAANPEQSAAIGQQTGGRVAFFLNTDDFAADHARLSKNGVKFCEKPRYEPYGIVAKFHDLFGNTWDLLQQAKN
ncbi:VOC family protein [Rhodobacteraceae bacterium]|nr:VOC family protein [Paracoccaceae bacterium]